MHTLNSRKLQLGMVVEKDFRMKHAEALNWAREARRHKIVNLFFILSLESALTSLPSTDGNSKQV
jgi:hypothetical protein